MQEFVKVPIRKLPGCEDLDIPQYMTPQAAGMDIRAAVQADTVIPPGEWREIPTGIAVALPDGYEAQIRPRSGLALRYGVGLVNAPGTVDADYRGEIKVILINFGREPFIVRRGDRVAQMVVQKVCRVYWELDGDHEPSHRGSGGFGSTGYGR
ncbi:MAG: dUTP diphosphatase [Syntrophales bacterium]|nr:dUTP diphosphatase [Syntrophales bacterium]